MIVGSLILLIVIASFVITFLIKKNIIKTNFSYTKTTQENTQNHGQIREMKDVTNSNKKE